MKKTLLFAIAVVSAPLAIFADIYVTPTGAGNKDGSSWANAFAGIQAAVDFVDAAVAADANYAIPVIRVADGTYSRVSITNDIALDVRSVNGAAATVIDGGGTNNCVAVITGNYIYSQRPTFTGFTLQNGNVRNQTYDYGGGALGGTLVDCVIQDCEAWQGGGTYKANTTRCIIRRCYASSYGGIVGYGLHLNDLMYGNSGYWGPIYSADLYSCTIADNTAESSYYSFIESSLARNCIRWNNTIYNYETGQYEPSAQSDPSDPKFVGGGDYRLRAGSPAFDDGLADWQTEAYVGLTDLAGNARVQGVKIDRGCYEGTALEGVLVTASAEGNGSVSPPHSFVPVGTSVTITADTSTWYRDVATWKTNGVVVAGATGNSFTFTATGEEIAVVAQFATLDWFVNGTTGSDTVNNGRTASTAFKTIQHAIDVAAPDEQIFVAAGTYAPIDASRANVAIIGDGRDTTVIDGGGTNRCANLGERNFSLLQGFTLRNGRRMNVGTNPGHGEEGIGGGGVKGGILYDCTITNCVSTFGGGAFHSEIHRSIIVDCSAYDGGGTIMGECYNCLFECNWAVQGGAASMASLWGCTVVKNRAVDYAAVYVSSAYSCVFKGNKSANGRTAYALQVHGECCFEEEMDDYNVSFTDDPLFVDFENGDYRLREDSPCIDHGWGDVLHDEYDVRGPGFPRRIDALGGEEIADMGCYEGGVPLEQVPTPAVPAATRTINVSGGGAALQNAINVANDGDTLLVAAGTYSAIDASGKALNIVGAGPATTIIRGTASTRAVTFSPSMTRPNSSISGFTIEGGTSTDLRYGGGGVLGGTVSNCVIRGNSAYMGGGVAQAYVTHSIISNNTATVSGGGACASWLDTCLVVHNAANVNLAGFDTSAYGGGVPSANDNESGGGGIAFAAANFCTITRNTSTTYAGGGMFVVLDNTYFAGNTATLGGQYRQNGDLFPVYPSYVCATSPTFPDADGFVNATQDDSLADPDNGDYRLKATSLCVEGADPTDETRRTATDLDGNPRWRGSAPDIGCYEAAGVLPAAVQGVEAATGLSAIEGGEGVALWWDVTRGAEWYTVHRGTTSNDYASATLLATVQTPTVEFNDFTATAGVDYYYWVVAHSSLGDGPAGASVLGNWVTELVITTPYLPDGLTRETYTTNLTAQGGIAPYTWTVTTPSWLSFSGSTLSGMPPSRGTETVVVTVSDASGQQAERRYDLTINRNPAPLGPATPYAGECYEGNYLIQNYEQLRLFESRLHMEDGEYGSYFEDCTFTLSGDIDCGGRAFVPASSRMYAFKGTFDGAGHRIYNFTNDVVGCGSLVGYASDGAVVKNVTLEGYIRLSRVDGTPDWGAAAISEYVEGSADGTPGLTIRNCHFNGSIILYSSANNPYAGGLVGWADNRTFDATNAPPNVTNVVISGSSVNVERLSANTWAGGLVAIGWGVDVSDCAVTGTVATAQKIGGLAGELTNSTFRDCSFDGEVSTGRDISQTPASGGGGLIGVAAGVRFERCAARGLVNWEYFVRHDNFVPSECYYRTDPDWNFTGCGGAAGITFGDTSFHDCSFEGTVASTNGFFGGFVGWTAGSETFSNCSVRAIYAPGNYFFGYGTGGFAGVIASDGARFIDCSVEQLGGVRVRGGFFDRQTPVTVGDISDGVGSNAFVRCSVLNARTSAAGFCSGAWNCSFKDCSVRGGTTQGAGFVSGAGQVPGDGYLYAQNSSYEDCSVSGLATRQGFVYIANSGEKNGSTNVFRRCRAGGCIGFAYELNKGTLAEDCIAYGVSLQGDSTYGFAEYIRGGATVRRCVGAVLPRANETYGAGFACRVIYGAKIEDCYSVYGPSAAGVDQSGGSSYGIQGGFVQSTTIGYREGDDPIARCFALWPLREPASGNCGAFCGGTPYTSYPPFFEDCYRPAESAVDDCHDADDANVAALTKAQFANATAVTMPNYDFQNVWIAPQGIASSPYLTCSTDGRTNFWFAAAVVSGEGSILVNGEAPRDSYPIGATITVRAVPDGDGPFTGWVGEGFADPLAQETTYTVRNVSAIGATFGTPIRTVEDFLAIPNNASDAYVLMNDLDFTEFLSTNTYFSALSVDSFQGKFFGQGHTLRYVCTNCNSTSEAAAPFSSLLTGAELRDLTVESVVSNCYGKAAGLVASIGNGVLVTNCHARLVATAKPYSSQYYDNGGTCHYYGFAKDVNGSDIRIIDCTADLKAVANGAAAGFASSIQMTGGEIARCAVFAEMMATNSYCTGYGRVSGFASDISLSGGATVRECFAAGVADGKGETVGFAYQINLGDAESSIRDCYSTMEVVSRENSAAGFAYNLYDSTYNYEAGVSNLWFGGSVRAASTAYGFANYMSYVNAVNCYRVKADAASSTDGVTDIVPAAARQSASWTGFDFDDVWTMADGATTPYFAWSLADGNFRLFAENEPGTVITHPYDAALGSNVAISVAAEDPGLFFCQWAGGATYTNAAVNPSAILADNHRAVRCVWGKAITTRAELAAIADDPTGVYALGCDIDLGGEPWTPLCQDEYTPFTGTLYGNGHTISNMTVETETARAGLFGGLGAGATIADLNLAKPVVRGANCVGTLAGYVEGATIGGCTVSGADVTATSERAGCFVGQLEGAATVTRCSATGRIAGSGRYVGGFVGSVAGTTALEKCFALAEVSGAGEGVGGFAGYAEDTPSFSECFACGSVDSTGTSAGGFAGYLSGSPAVSDCYALETVKGGSYVGGFAGQLNYCNTAFDRCYAAGTETSTGEAGGFVGRQYRGSPSFADCFRISGGRGDVGAEDVAGIDALDAAGMRSTDNFAAFLETEKWTQADGLTQPYFAWSLVDGKMTLSGAIAGTGDGAITGLGAYAPGTVVQISAVPSGSVFLGWTGNAPYADPSEQTTTVTLDNFRIVTAEFGSLIMNVDQLAGITNVLSGSFALGADIDLSEAAWTPIGTSSQPFTGSLYGQGHSISGLTFGNTSSGDANGSHAGLFRYAKDATFVGIVLEDVDLDGYQYVGALAGEVQGTTTVRDCSASGTVKSSNGYVGMLVGRVYNANGTAFEGCEAEGAVESVGANAGGLVGDIYNSTVSFEDCAAGVAVSGTGGNNKGGFAGCIESGGSVTFLDCRAEGDVTAPNSQYVGGFVGNAARPVRCENCQTFGDTSGSSYTGGFVGQAGGGESVFLDCVANGVVTTATANGSQVGGFVGYANGAKSRYENCAASGAVSAGSGGQVGGFVGQSYAAGIVFADCLARGTDVRTTGSAVGGFAGKSTASNEFTRCQAKALAVSGSGSVGGFVGSSEGGNLQYAECEAHGSVAATGSGAGGFAGQTTGGGTRYSECRALGSAATTSNRAGGFAGYVSGANAFWRCFSAGSATASHEVGGFLGYNNGGGTTATECFALGDATATRTGNDAIAGGFLGYGYYGVGFTDCYCLGTVKGERVVGGFAGYLYDSGNTFTRCYAAGALECSGTWAGAFVGYPRNYGAITDCATLCTGDLHAFGTGTAGTSEAKENIAEYDAAGMKDSGNFGTWLAIDDADGAVWTQADGVTQPYLAWSSPDGDLMVYASVGGSASGRIDGAGVWYAPGDNATVTAIPDGGFFVTWTGSTPYADASSPTTTIALDNHRVAAVQFGKLITTADELDAVRNDLAGVYGLGSDIDLAGRDWTPIGSTESLKFTGAFYGNGHAVKNLTCTNNPSNYSNKWRGLFGCAAGATIDGVTVENCDIAGYQYVGALVGRIYDGTAITGCSASGKVYSYNGYAGGLVGSCEDGAFSIRGSSAAVEVTGGSNLGGFIGRAYGSGASVIADCRADGFAGGTGSVGGFVGYVSAPLFATNCVARGDVKSTGSSYGGFVGYVSNAGATNIACWCSGAVWGTGNNIGSFVGQRSNGSFVDCDVYPYANGVRPFCGNSASITGGVFSSEEVKTRSAGWPKVAKRENTVPAIPIATVEELFAVTNNLTTNYVLTADIDLGGAAWTPIGQSTAFTGEFYGKNHAISNYIVTTTAQNAGLFGKIGGGRVSGVRAYGSVTGSNSYVGGFAGKVESYSMVDGCSFEGAVESSSTYVGGFVGQTYGSPNILRCCASGTVAKTDTSTSSAYIGGFVGQHSAGWISDSYALSSVNAGKAGYAGGFAGYVGSASSTRIATSYCSASIATNSFSYIGAFGGNVSAGSVTNSYYNSGATDLLAQGQSNKASISYVGITPVAGADMKKQSSFPAFDFDATWNIDEGETMPYLQTFIVVKSGFDIWTEQSGYPEGTEPGDVIDGIPAGIRYVYNIPAEAASLYALPGEEFFCIVMDAYGNPCVKFRAKRDPYEGVRVIETVYATTDLTDMAESDSAKWQHRVQMRHDVLDDTWKPADGVFRPAMFFRWSVSVARAEE